MPTGAAHRFSDTAPPAGGNLTADNINSLDPGLNVYVSPNGGLNVRVTAGVIFVVTGGALTRSDNAGQASDITLSPSTTNYLFLNAAGVVTVAAAFPATPHLPLASVVTSGSAVTSIADKRPRAILFANGSPFGDQGVYTAGTYYGQSGGAADTTGSLTADTLYLIRFDVTRQVTIDTLALDVSTADAGSTGRIGIYAEGSTPDSPAGGALVFDPGAASFAAATTGVKAPSASATLQPGRYFFALTVSSGSVAFRAVSAARRAAHGLRATTFSGGQTMWTGGALTPATAFPSTCPAATIDNNPAPLVAFRAA